MKEKIFTALKAAILINGKTSISDATITTFVGLIDSEKITDESQIAEAIKPHVLVLQAMQANINSVAAGAVTAKESELKTAYEKQIEELKKSTPEPPKKEPEWKDAISGLTKNVETLASVITQMQGEKTQTSLSQKLTEDLKSKGIPDWYANPIIGGRKFNDEAEVNQFAESITEGWKSAKQELANNGFKETVPPGQGNGDHKDVDTLVAQIQEGTKAILSEQNKN